MSWLALGAAGLTALGGLGASAMNANSASVSSKKSFKYTKWLQEWQASELPRLQKQGLIDAGYNPILAVNGGHTPIGGTLSAQAAHYENPFGSLGSLARDSAEVRKADATIENLENTNELISANTAKAEAEAKTQEALQIKALSEARAVEQSILQNAPNAKQAKVISDMIDTNPSIRRVIERSYLIDKSPKRLDDAILRGILGGSYDDILDFNSNSSKDIRRNSDELKREIKKQSSNMNYEKTKKYSSGWLPTGR